MNIHSICRLVLIMLSLTPLVATAQGHSVSYNASFTGNTGSGDFAPYYIASNRHGILTQTHNALLQAGLWHEMDTERRFSFGYGVDVLGGLSSSTDYTRYNSDIKDFVVNSQKPAALWLQQLYAEIKYRQVFISVGMKQHESKLLNSRLSSGDLIESGNARPIPEARAGFLDFVNIPLTNDWVQIGGEISYGKFTQDEYMRNHYNYYSYHINTGGWYTYKRAYFRTKPSERFSVTIGAQAAGLFGGVTDDYRQGVKTNSYEHPDGIGDFFEMFIPKNTSEEGFVLGNHLGSWDFKARYRLKNNDEIMAYFQWPWEDGSGIGKLNGFDGLWGIEYKTASGGIVNGIVVEYLDFTNQSGPMHWDPDDMPGTTITDRAEGGDNYYNNSFYNSYSNYGMAIGSPFLFSPLYNLDGYPAFVSNRIRGFHAGIEGQLSQSLDYRVMGSYRKGWGSGRNPIVNTLEDTSASIEARYKVSQVPGLVINAQLAFDSGSMYGDNFGCLMSVSYTGNFSLTR